MLPSQVPRDEAFWALGSRVHMSGLAGASARSRGLAPWLGVYREDGVYRPRMMGGGGCRVDLMSRKVPK